MQIQKCSLLICQGAVKPLEERIQQQLILKHAKRMKSPRHQSCFLHEKDPLARSVFSFRLNYSRKYSDSDKYKQLFAEEHGKSTRPYTQMHNCKSAQRPPFRLIQQSVPQPDKTRYFTSPFQRKTVIYAPLGQQNFPRKPLGKGDNWKQQQGKHLIRFISGNGATFNQPLDNNSKHSAQTQNSSISSQNEINRKQQKLTKHFPFLKAPQVIRVQQALRAEKSPLKNSSFGFKSDKSMNEQIVYPSFDKLQIIEHRRFFDNANTIKTIFTSNQLKQRSIDNSSKQLAPQVPNYDDSGTLQFAEHRLNKEKFFAGNRKRTAYFGSIDQDNQDNQQISRFKQGQPSHYNHENQNKKTINQSKKVHFQAGSHLTSSIIGTSQNLFDKGSNVAIRQTKYERRNCQPSLHNIIQSKKVQHKISIQSSFNEMPLITPVNDNEHRFKYVNTIKSIGGQSLQSQNSYIDIKFMQNLNKRTPIVKLVE